VGTGVAASTEDDDETPYGKRPTIDNSFENLLERAARAVAERDWDGPRVYEMKKCDSIEDLVNHAIARFRDGEGEHQTAALFQSVMVGEGAPRGMWQRVNHYYG